MALNPTAGQARHNGSYQTYWYDNNGNMTWRDEYSPGQTYMAFWQGYTPDNKLYIAVGYGWNAGAGQWEFNNVYSFFYYDADGQRVRKDDPNGTTAYAGAHFEQNAYTGVQRATYSFNGQVVAVRNGATTSWVHSDHLGSASLATDYTGVPIAGSETRYTPWGEVRTGGVGAITDRGFTSQRREDNIRLNDYVARFYNPFIGKFIQPDSVVPGAGNPQSFNRFAYGFNSPLRYTDPSGHDPSNTQYNYAGPEAVASNLQSYVQGTIRSQVGAGTLNPVEGLTRIADYTMSMVGSGNVKWFMWAMTVVLLGVDPHTKFLPEAFLAEDYGGPYFAGFGVLPYGMGVGSDRSQLGDWNPSLIVGDEGMGNPDVGSANQGFHFWGLVALAYYGGWVWSAAANNFHDPVVIDAASKALSDRSLYENRNSRWLAQANQWWASKTDGTSSADYNLGLVGMGFGNYARVYSPMCVGNICTSPSSSQFDPSNWIRTNLGVSAK